MFKEVKSVVPDMVALVSKISVAIYEKTAK